MNGSGIFAFYWIRRYFPEARCTSARIPDTGRPVLWEEEEQNSGHLVVLEERELKAVSRHWENTIFLCACREQVKIGHQNTAILLNEKASLPRVMNAALAIWDRYEKWMAELEDAVNHLYSYLAVIRSCDCLLEDPLALMDVQFRYVGYSKHLAARNGYEKKYVDAEMRLPLEDINYLTAMPDFRKLESIQDTFQYICIENILHKNIYHNGMYVGRLALPASGDPVKDAYYRHILTVVAGYTERLYQKLGTFRLQKQSDNHWKQILTRLLAGEAVDQGVLRRSLENLQYGSRDRYYLLQFRSRAADNENKLNESLASHMESLWPGITCLVYPGKITALLNLTRYGEMTRKTFTQELAYFLRESLLSAGFSRCFCNLGSLPAAALQTDIALDTGSLMDSTWWYYKFDDYAYRHLLRCGSGTFLPEQICSPVILILREYDGQHHTQLEQTLYIYLECQYNALAASRELCIARSSFLKRMERIQALTGLKLEDREQRVYLELSYELFRLEKNDGQ